MPRPADVPPPMYGEDGLLLDGAITLRLGWYTEKLRQMTPEQRAEVDARARAEAMRIDPTGRLLHLIEIGPEGYAKERETAILCTEPKVGRFEDYVDG